MDGNKIKCVFCDLDGTLIPSSTSLQQADAKDIDAVKSWINKGKDFVVATGRDRGYINPVMEVFGTDLNFIASNGASIIQDSKEIFINTIGKEKFSRFWEIFQVISNKADFIATLTDLSIVAEQEKKENHYLNRILTHNTFGIEEYLSIVSKEIYKISIFIYEKDEMESLYTYLSDALEPKLHVYRTGAKIMEIVNQGVNKWIAVQKYCEIMNYTLDEIVVIGDEDNDFEMIDKAPHSFAMSTGKQEVVDAATYAVDSVAEMFNTYLGGKADD